MSAAAVPGPSRRNPATLGERRRMQPPRMARAAVDLSVRFLPVEHRERYAVEFYADLFGLPRKEQRRQAFGVLLHVQQLAWALGDPAPDLERRPARSRDLRCMLHLHHYVKRHVHDAEDGIRSVLMCTRCNKDLYIPVGRMGGDLAGFGNGSM